MKLHELVLSSKNIIDSLIQNGGELTPELEIELQNMEKELSYKSDKYNYVIERLDLEEKYWKDKAAIYNNVSKSCKKMKEKIKERIKEAMKAMNKKEIEGMDFKFKLVKQGKAVDIDNEDHIPPAFFNEEISYKLDKKRLIEALQVEGNIKGCHLRDVLSLRIYPNRSDKW